MGGEVGVAPVDVLALVHHGLALRGQARDRERGTGAHVEGLHRRTGEPLDPAHDRVAALVADVGAHARELVDELEPAVVHVLGHDRGAVGHREQRDDHRHEVGGEARERQRGHVDRVQPRARLRPEPVGSRRHPQAHLPELHDHELEVFRPHTRELDLPARDAARHDQRAGLDAIAHELTLDRVELFGTLDLEGGGARAHDVRAHAIEERAEIGDLGLARRVLDDGRALRARGRGDEVLRRADTRELEHDPVARQARRGARVDVAVAHVDLGAQRLEAPEVHVDLAAPDVVAAGHRDARFAAAREQRTEHVDRRAHARDDLVRRLGLELAARVDRERVGPRPRGTRAEHAEELDHHVEIGDRRDVGDRGDARREQRGGHLLGAGVLGRARDANGALDAMTGAHEEARHRRRAYRWRPPKPAL